MLTERQEEWLESVPKKARGTVRQYLPGQELVNAEGKHYWVTGYFHPPGDKEHTHLVVVPKKPTVPEDYEPYNPLAQLLCWKCAKGRLKKVQTDDFFVGIPMLARRAAVAPSADMLGWIQAAYRAPSRDPKGPGSTNGPV